MKKEHLAKALEIITNTQFSDNGVGGSAPVKLSIGYVTKDKQVHDGLVIYDCPPIIIDKLIKEGFSLAMGDGGLYVTKF